MLILMRSAPVELCDTHKISAASACRSSPWKPRGQRTDPHCLSLPLFGAHRLVANAVHGVDFDLVVEHAEVASKRHQRSMLVVHLHAQRSVHRLRDFGNRGGRLVADLVGVDERDPGHQDTPCLPLLVVLEKPRALSSRMTFLEKALCRWWLPGAGLSKGLGEDLASARN